MISRLKQILLKMVRISSSDQRWILRQLTDDQLAKFKRYNGSDILESAKRFRNMDIKHLVMPTALQNPLPACCTQLAMKAPLYAAIILEQGSYPWQSDFLKQFDSDNLVSDMLENRVPDIKEAVKQALYSEWESTKDMDDLQPFENYLEDVHG